MEPTQLIEKTFARRRLSGGTRMNPYDEEYKTNNLISKSNHGLDQHLSNNKKSNYKTHEWTVDEIRSTRPLMAPIRVET